MPGCIVGTLTLFTGNEALSYCRIFRTPKLTFMPVRLSELDIRVLEVIEEKGRTYFEEIQRELRFEFPYANWHQCFNLISQKNYIIDVTEPGFRGFIELTDEGKMKLKSYRHQPPLRDVRPVIHNVITTPNNTDSTRIAKITLYWTIAAVVLALIIWLWPELRKVLSSLF